MPEQERPSKKQRELLEYIKRFITEHGYGPSYREIMNGCNYSSVATVAVHVNNLIKKGHLRKKDRSARSLELVDSSGSQPKNLRPTQDDESGKKWLMSHIERKLAAKEDDQQKQAEIQKLAQALRALGLGNIADNLENRS